MVCCHGILSNKASLLCPSCLGLAKSLRCCTADGTVHVRVSAAFHADHVLHLLHVEVDVVACPVQACVSGMFELKEDSAFKAHLRDFLVQTKSFADKNNADLFAEEAAAAREVLPQLLLCYLWCGPLRCCICSRVEPIPQKKRHAGGVVVPVGCCHRTAQMCTCPVQECWLSYCTQPALNANARLRECLSACCHRRSGRDWQPSRA